ncbi:hypothetical protein [Sphingomonas aerophila]|uniref:Uncharacterized protein n=1 Tax=Sphingomonas aerophila TaxID=1344948 RepID=A0A7W9BDE3_9SPHN|nr:hypothetical protein [Sphingomonas aerophila]MBB5715209.1 hypothetical protein [Sphingomonas aerophila]
MQAAKAGAELTLSGAILVFWNLAPPDRRDLARRFLRVLVAGYSALPAAAAISGLGRAIGADRS